MTRRITWPVGGSVGAAVSDVDDAQPLPVNGAVAGAQVAIPNLATPALVLLSDVIAATGTLRTTMNTLLGELRTAGVILP